MNWFVKKADGAVYGPVDRETLRYWAADGRILPDDLVSADESDWSPAPQLADLQMDWFVELDNGELYGPIPLLATRDLLLAGHALPGARIVHRDTQEERTLAEAVVSALLAQNTDLQEYCQKMSAKVDDLERSVGTYEHLFGEESTDGLALKARVQRELKTSLERRDAFERESVRWKRLYEDERENNARHEASLTEQIRRMRGEELESRRVIEGLEQKLREIEKGDQFASQIHVVHGTESSAASVDAGSLLAAYKILSRNYDKLVEQLAMKAQEISELMESRASMEHEAASRIRGLEETLKREQEEADSARKKLIDMEETHLQLVQAYRDLNDRYVRSRQHAHVQAPPSRREAQPPQPEGPRIRLI